MCPASDRGPRLVPAQRHAFGAAFEADAGPRVGPLARLLENAPLFSTTWNKKACLYAASGWSKGAGQATGAP